MSDELYLEDILEELMGDYIREIDREAGEFTVNDLMGLRPEMTRRMVEYYLKKAIARGELTRRQAYDPKAKRRVWAYKKVE